MKRIFWYWLFFIFVITLVSLPTLTISPIVWQDETQILDYGRTSIDLTGSSFGLNWLPEPNQPNIIFNFVGPAYLELGYLISKPYYGLLGARSFVLIAAIAASFSLLNWLLRIGTSPNTALLASMLLISDPMIVQSYRGGRVDILAMAFLFTALWISSCKSLKNKIYFYLQIIFTGIFLSLCLLTWPTSVLLMPLFVYCALFDNLISEHLIDLKGKLKKLSLIGLSTLISILLIHSFFNFNNLHSIFNTASFASGRVQNIDINTFYTFLNAFKYNPFFFILSIFFMLVTKRYILFLIFSCILYIILLTNPYIHRSIYLIPYFIVSLILFLSINKNSKYPKIITVLLIIFGLMVGYLSRGFIAYKESALRDYSLIKSLANLNIGEGNFKVYLDDYTFYYAARELGWQYFRLSDSIIYNDNKYSYYLDPDSGFYNKFQYVIFNNKNLDQLKRNKLYRQGFLCRNQKIFYDVNHGYSGVYVFCMNMNFKN